MVTAFSDIGIEEITGGKKAFVNFTTELLLHEIPFMLSNNILVVELLESVKPTKPVLEMCAKLKKRGFLIALDDFVYSPEYEPLIDLADIIKIDFIKSGQDNLKEQVRKINSGRRKVLLAEKIESYGDLELARSLGFTLFQGFFFCRPRITNSKSVDTLEMSKFMLLRHIGNPDVNFTDLAVIIKRDVALSYRLLKIVNSAYYGLQYTVTGILHALTILGLNEIKRWISLILLCENKSAKPSELIRAALVRGIFMENLALHLRKSKNRDEFFMVGIFSLAEAIMDSPLEFIIKQAHLSSEISRPLLTGKGQAAQLLQILMHLERAEWEQVADIAQKCGLEQRTVNRCYMEAMVSANKALR